MSTALVRRQRYVEDSTDPTWWAHQKLNKKTPWRKQPFNTTINPPTQQSTLQQNKTNTHKQGEQSVVGWREREGVKVPKNGALNGVFETPSRVLKQTKFDMWHFPPKTQVGFYWKQYRGCKRFIPCRNIQNGLVLVSKFTSVHTFMYNSTDCSWTHKITQHNSHEYWLPVHNSTVLQITHRIIPKKDQYVYPVQLYILISHTHKKAYDGIASYN
jgi:hypothetical protein